MLKEEEEGTRKEKENLINVIFARLFDAFFCLFFDIVQIQFLSLSPSLLFSSRLKFKEKFFLFICQLIQKLT